MVSIENESQSTFLLERHMQKHRIGLLATIYGIAILSGVTLNWVGVFVVEIAYLVFFLREFTKTPSLMMSLAVSGRSNAGYAWPLFLSILLMLFLGFLSHNYGWQHIFDFLGQTFLRK